MILLDTQIWVWWVSQPDRLQLPPPFHRDPADQLLVATARVLQCPILTEDSKINTYAHVQHA